MPLLRIWATTFFLVVAVVGSDTAVAVAATLPYCAPNQQPELLESYFRPPDPELMPPVTDEEEQYAFNIVREEYMPYRPMTERGYSELTAFVGGDLGTPLECLHDAGAVKVQRITRGMMVWRFDDRLIIFSDGQRNWAISGITSYDILQDLAANRTPREPFTWEGSPASPPGLATLAVSPDQPFAPPR